MPLIVFMFCMSGTPDLQATAQAPRSGIEPWENRGAGESEEIGKTGIRVMYRFTQDVQSATSELKNASNREQRGPHKARLQGRVLAGVAARAADAGTGMVPQLAGEEAYTTTGKFCCALKLSPQVRLKEGRGGQQFSF